MKKKQAKQSKVSAMTQQQVNTLLMRLMGIPLRSQKAYRKANKLA